VGFYGDEPVTTNGGSAEAAIDKSLDQWDQCLATIGGKENAPVFDGKIQAIGMFGIEIQPINLVVSKLFPRDSEVIRAEKAERGSGIDSGRVSRILANDVSPAVRVGDAHQLAPGISSI